MEAYYSDEEVIALVGITGPEQVGARYATRKRQSLDSIGTANYNAFTDRNSDPDIWIDEALSFADYLPCETRFRMVLAAVNAAADDDQVLWCIADMPVSHLVYECSLHERFHAQRSASPAVEHMFRLMQNYYRAIRDEPHAGWWEDDFEQYLRDDA